MNICNIYLYLYILILIYVKYIFHSRQSVRNAEKREQIGKLQNSINSTWKALESVGEIIFDLHPEKLYV